MSSCGHMTTECDIVCKHVAEGQRPILYVWRYADNGQWSYNCGFDDHEAGEGYVGICRDCGSIKLSELPNFPMIEAGQEAWRERSEDSNWHVAEILEENHDHNNH